VQKDPRFWFVGAHGRFLNETERFSRFETEKRSVSFKNVQSRRGAGGDRDLA
jgi:hypothetical protein